MQVELEAAASPMVEVENSLLKLLKLATVSVFLTGALAGSQQQAFGTQHDFSLTTLVVVWAVSTLSLEQQSARAGE